eukprot:TRINITY_DN782129_c0_g1_i1.p1 TRINITY_DN782129_c0_g1~~TRINITY_DN782129_c0_g1_i1.p1  ORF type:complete len:312 (+),score=106.34 TRINITY_DN782129_c0_g1_i1:124-936(+)
MWITGASSGIGRAFAVLLSKNGANLILSGRKVDELKKTKAMCVEAGADETTIAYLPFDNNDYDAADIAKKGIAFFGKVDRVFLNAGRSCRCFIEECENVVDRDIFETNFFGTINLLKALLPHFIERKSGHFITVSSVVGKLHPPFRGPYVASKAALEAYFNVLRAEVAHYNIQCSVVNPGFIATNVSLNAAGADGKDYGHMDTTTASGFTPEQLSQWMLEDVIYERKADLNYFQFKQTIGLYLKFFVPGYFRKYMANRAMSHRESGHDVQ